AKCFTFKSEEYRQKLRTPQVVPISRIADRNWQLISESASTQALDSFLNDLIKTVPETKIVPLDELANVSMGISYSRDGMVEPKEYRQKFKAPPIGLLRVSDLPRGKTLKKEGFFTMFCQRILTPEAASKVREEAYLKRGDVLVSVGGTVGRVGSFLDFDNEI